MSSYASTPNSKGKQAEVGASGEKSANSSGHRRNTQSQTDNIIDHFNNGVMIPLHGRVPPLQDPIGTARNTSPREARQPVFGPHPLAIMNQPWGSTLGVTQAGGHVRNESSHSHASYAANLHDMPDAESLVPSGILNSSPSRQARQLNVEIGSIDRVIEDTRSVIRHNVRADSAGSPSRRTSPAGSPKPMTASIEPTPNPSAQDHAALVTALQTISQLTAQLSLQPTPANQQSQTLAQLQTLAQTMVQAQTQTQAHAQTLAVMQERMDRLDQTIAAMPRLISEGVADALKTPQVISHIVRTLVNDPAAIQAIQNGMPLTPPLAWGPSPITTAPPHPIHVADPFTNVANNQLIRSGGGGNSGSHRSGSARNSPTALQFGSAAQTPTHSRIAHFPVKDVATNLLENFQRTREWVLKHCTVFFSVLSNDKMVKDLISVCGRHMGSENAAKVVLENVEHRLYLIEGHLTRLLIDAIYEQPLVEGFACAQLNDFMKAWDEAGGLRAYDPANHHRRDQAQQKLARLATIIKNSPGVGDYQNDLADGITSHMYDQISVMVSSDNHEFAYKDLREVVIKYVRLGVRMRSEEPTYTFTWSTYHQNFDQRANVFRNPAFGGVFPASLRNSIIDVPINPTVMMQKFGANAEKKVIFKGEAIIRARLGAPAR